MDAKEHEYFIQWIISDYIPIGEAYYVSSPNRRAKMQAEEIFFEFYYRGVEEGLIDGEDLYKLLIKHSLWDDKKEATLNTMLEEIDDMKVEIFNNYLNSGSRNKIKRALADTQTYISGLLESKHFFDQYTAEGIANYAKHQFLLGNSIYKKGKPFKGWACPNNILNAAVKKVLKFKLGVADYRELARCDVWRVMWNIKRGNTIFGKPLVDWSDAQRSLVSWSTLYDNIYKSADCPPDDIINDDDAVDGWLITQRRKREAENNKAAISGILTNEKIKNSDHVFIMADEKNIKKVYDMNDIGGKIALGKRLTQIKKEGHVTETNLIDTREYLREQATNLFREKMNGTT